MAPLAPPQGLPAERDFHRAKPKSSAPLQKPESIHPIPPRLENRTGFQQNKTVKTSLGRKDQLPIVMVGIIDPVIIIVIEGELAGIGPWEGGGLSVLIDIFELEFPNRLEVTGGGDALQGSQFDQLVLQDALQLVQQAA